LLRWGARRAMSLRSDLYAKSVLPLVENKTYAGLHPLLQQGRGAENRSLEENLRIQWSQVKETLKHAYATVPFYKARFDANKIHIDDIRGPNDMRAIPVLTRQDIRDNFEHLWSREYSRESLQEAAT